MSIRVLLADDHGVVRKGLRTLLESSPDIEVVGEASDGREVVRLEKELEPDVVIMDITMPLLNGIDAASQIARREGHAKVIILSMHSHESYVVKALTAGATGYLLKDSAENDVVAAVNSVIQSRPFFSPAIGQSLLEDYVRMRGQHSLRDSYELLTEREREILQLLAEGKSNKEVATLLNLSHHTVETHRTNLMQKLDLHNTAEIVLYAVRTGLIVP